MTFICDPAAYRLVFYAKGSEEASLESAKLAYHWFGIPKQLSMDYTFAGLGKVLLQV